MKTLISAVLTAGLLIAATAVLVASLLIAATAHGQTVNRPTTWVDNSLNETGFVVQKCPGNCAVAGTFTWTQINVTPLPANTTSYTITGAPANATTSYRVGAVGAGGTGWSNIFVDVLPGVTANPPSSFNLPPCKTLTEVLPATNPKTYLCS